MPSRVLTDLSELLDVSAASPAAGDVLAWDDASSKWASGAPVIGGTVDAPSPALYDDPSTGLCSGGNDNVFSQMSIVVGGGQSVGFVVVDSRPTMYVFGDFMPTGGYQSGTSQYPICIGNVAKTSLNGNSQIAVGDRAQTDGLESIAIGVSAVAEADDSIAIGQYTQASATKAFAFGVGTSAIGENSLAMGFTAQALSNSSIAIGDEASVDSDSDYGIAIGSEAEASGKCSVALGFGCVADAPFTTVIGNSSLSAADAYSFNLTRFDPSTKPEPALNVWGNVDTTSRRLCTFAMQWADSTDATRKSRVTFNSYDYNGTRESIRIEADGTQALLGFFGADAVAKPAITGSRGGNAALASLLTALADLGLITDTTTAS